LKNFKAVLFPHTTLKEGDLKRILFLFSQLTIFQPWYMDLPLSLRTYRGESLITVIYPPDDFRPEKDVKEILSGYEGWINQLNKKDYPSSLKAALKLSVADEHSWDIRKSIHGPEDTSSENTYSPWLEWHILLHLARKLEESSYEAYDLLDLVRTKKSPLEEALEGKTMAPGLLDDVPIPNVYSNLGEEQINGIIRAWLGLFGDYLDRYNLLITTDQDVMSTIKGAFEMTESRKPESDSPTSIQLTIPDFLKPEMENSTDGSAIALNKPASNILEDILMAMQKPAGVDEDKLMALSALFQTEAPSTTGGENFSINILFLNGIPSVSKKNKEPELTVLNGKFVFHLEKNNN
jgi:hypothetical protein